MVPHQKRPCGSQPPSFMRTPGRSRISHSGHGRSCASSRTTPVSVATTRPPAARGRTIAATGLGVAIARRGVAWHAGEAVPLRLLTAARASAGWSDGALELRAPGAEGAVRTLDRWYRESARAALEESIERQAPGLGVAPTTVAVRDQRTRWGSCSSRGTLSFSWRLLLAPAWVLDDVVCHELCHLRVANHSQAFWRLFASHRPAADSRPWLRAHGGVLAASCPADSI